VNGYVLYLNLWGTTAKLWEKTPGDHLFPESDLVACQKHFTNVLRSLARNSPALRVTQMGDLALATSSDSHALLRFTATVFQEMAIERVGSEERFRLWPLRGAIAKGIRENFGERSDTPGFSGASVPGTGSVEAAYLEKSAQKGMCLFLTREAARDIPAGLSRLTRTRLTRGVEHFEFNWMKAQTIENSTPFLGRQVQDRTVREHLHRTSRELIDIESNYFQQMGASISDLLSWERT
jgi:hypothetical protein